MPAPQNAIARITLFRPFLGITHAHHVYVQCVLSGPPFSLTTRTGGSLLFSLAAQGYWDAIKIADGSLSASDIPPVVLSKKVGLLWVPIEYYTVTGNGLAGSSNIQAGQITVVLRDTANYQVKQVMLEGYSPGTPKHFASVASGAQEAQNFARQFTEAHTVTNSPFTWAVGLSNDFLAPTPHIGTTLTFNRKIRRRRGLA